MSKYKPILVLPEINITLKPFNTIKLDRFSDIEWIVQYGWFQFDNNHKICGWYLLSNDKESKIKPLTDVDIIDIYMVDR